jgi:hypothetical protein
MTALSKRQSADTGPELFERAAGEQASVVAVMGSMHQTCGRDGLRARSGPARARLLMRIAAYSCARDMNKYMMCCMHTRSCVAVYWFDHYPKTV